MSVKGQKVWESPGDRHGVWSAILFADMVGFSRMMSRDERGVIDFMIGCFRMIEEVGRRYGGVLVQTTGDGFLLLFETTQGAVSFGQELHHLVAKRQASIPEPAMFRVGIHSGEVHRYGGMIQGHAVNVAARLESEAAPGTCVVSQEVRDALAVTETDGWILESIGAPPLKNIAERRQLYRLRPEGSASASKSTPLPVVSVIGDVSLRTPVGNISFAPGRKTTSLLGYLALSEGQREKNTKIARMLWPDQSTAAANRAFSACRKQLSTHLGKVSPDLLYSVNGHTGLNEVHFETDLSNVLTDLRRGRVNAMLIEQADWPTRILEGVEVGNSVFETWRTVMQSTWRDRITAGLTDLMTRGRIEDDASRDAAKALVSLEPGNEAASAVLIRHLGHHGNRVAALEEYNRVAAYLEGTHGLAPSEQLRAARKAVTGSGPASPKIVAETPAPVPRRLLRLAVAPFTAPEGVDSHRIEGFRSELLANLARFREWSVVEGTGQVSDPASAGITMMTSAYLIGGVLGSDGRFSLSLKDLSVGRVVWIGDFTLDSENWIASQREAVGRISAHLETYVSADRLANVIGIAEHQATSHDLWLQAERVFARWTPEAAIEADQMLRDVIEEDPAFAPGYSSLASFCNVRHVIRPGTVRDADDAREADALAQRAVELDQLDARNHLAVAWTAGLTGAFDRATIHLDMAASLNPNSQMTLISCAMGYAFFGQAERGEALIDHVQRIAPMLSDYQWCYVASVHFLAGRYEDALKAANMSGDRIVDNQGWIAASLVQLGRIEEARTALDRLIDGVRPVWDGEDRPTAEAVFDWFTAAYPLRNPADQERLTESLGGALRGQ